LIFLAKKGNHMMKTKGTDVGKVGGNHPAGATLTGTEKTRVGGQMPATAPLPTMADMLPHLTATPNAQVVVPQDSTTLPMFNGTQGYTDTGVTNTGDLGGAA
jgi:hypothetical protein